MVVFPKAKINLGLRVTGRRPDGFHDIETIFYPVGLCDALEFVKADAGMQDDILTITGYDHGIRHEDNLVIKAARKLRETCRLPYLKIHLHKMIPSGAGLGGGSSDAACFLKTANRLFDLGLNKDELLKLALSIGSDCPFFIDSLPALGTGRGEVLKPVEKILGGLYIILANPGINISTREAYENCIPEKPGKSLSELIKNPVNEWKNLIKNDFENYVFTRHPSAALIKESFYREGALYSSLSGSGSTVYGLFPEKRDPPGDLKDFVIYSEVI